MGVIILIHTVAASLPRRPTPRPPLLLVFTPWAVPSTGVVCVANRRQQKGHRTAASTLDAHSHSCAFPLLDGGLEETSYTSREYSSSYGDAD